MKAPQSTLMEVGVRELRDHLSRFLDLVRDGEEVTVTEHGRPIARLVAYGEPSTIDRLIAEGVITPAQRPKRTKLGPLIKARGSVSELVVEDRRSGR